MSSSLGTKVRKGLSTKVKRKIKFMKSIDWIRNVVLRPLPLEVADLVLKDVIFCHHCDRFSEQRCLESRREVPYEFGPNGWRVPSVTQPLCRVSEMFNCWEYGYGIKRKRMTRDQIQEDRLVACTLQREEDSQEAELKGNWNTRRLKTQRFQ